MSQKQRVYAVLSGVVSLNDEQPATALASVNGKDRGNGCSGQAGRCVDSMAQYLGYCSYWRKRFVAFFGSYSFKAVAEHAGQAQSDLGRL